MIAAAAGSSAAVSSIASRRHDSKGRTRDIVQSHFRNVNSIHNQNTAQAEAPAEAHTHQAQETDQQRTSDARPQFHHGITKPPRQRARCDSCIASPKEIFPTGVCAACNAVRAAQLRQLENDAAARDGFASASQKMTIMDAAERLSCEDEHRTPHISLFVSVVGV